MADDVNHWDQQKLARRLAWLDSRAATVIWTKAAGLVRVRCLVAQRLWEFRPVCGTWAWLMVGTTDKAAQLWAVSYSDGANPPERVVESPCGAESVLWDAIDFLTYDLAGTPNE